MALAPGSRIGVYEVSGPLEKGGAGEVYRARDTRLGRDVAIKVLRGLADGEEIARFRKEAKLLAAFAHPHIVGVYALEEVEGCPALVMELVKGDDLRRIVSSRGALRLDSVRRIGRQVALALEAAAERGIVHRDLKPGNIVMTDNETVKVLDFGIAKQLDRAPSGTIAVAPATDVLETQPWKVRGTPCYMAPEQIRGDAVDHRADIWAFGCVIFELLSGARAFPGTDTPRVLNQVLESDPDWSRLPGDLPANIRRMVQRCLRKDPDRRLHHIADARLELEEADEPVKPTGARHPALVVALATAFAAAGAVGGWVMASRSNSNVDAPAQTTHFHLQGPPGVEALPALANAFAISPDGRTLVQIGVREGVRAMFAFDTARAQFKEIAAANPASAVTFSPDGSRIAFLSASNRLGTFALRDEELHFLVTGVDLTSGLAWCDRAIVFPRGGTLWTADPATGATRQLTTLDPGRQEITHGAPLCLPGHDAIVYSSLTSERGAERIEMISLSGGPQTLVMDGATAAAWSGTGHLIFQRAGTVRGVAFDPKTRRVTGTPVELFEAGQVASNVFGSAGLALSASGTLVYVPGDFALRRLVTVSGDGAAKVIDVIPGRYFNPRVSPDGTKIAFDDDQSTIGILDLLRGTRAPFAPPMAGTNYSAWNMDGTRLVFRRSNRPYWAPTNGRGEPDPVPDTSTADFPISAGPDTDSVFVVRIGGATSGDVYLVSMTGRFEPRAVVSTRGFDGSPHLSPDRRWLLYQSDESGKPEVYVSPYPSMARRWQVSADGGIQTVWGRSGREVFFRQGSRMFRVSVNLDGPEPVFGKPTLMFDQAYDYGQGVSAPDYAAMPGGGFVMIRPEAGSSRLHVALHWTETLRQRMSGTVAR